MSRETSQKYNTAVLDIVVKDFSDDSLLSQKLGHEKEEQACRICMEKESPLQRLISPCRCRGSMKYIHEECLKTWLVSQECEIATSQCELCKTEFKMEVKLKKKCSPMNMCRDGITQCMAVPLFISVGGMFFLIVFMMWDKFVDYENGEIDGYRLTLIFIFLMFGLFVVLLIMNAIKESCIISTISGWVIHNQNFDECEDKPSFIEHEEKRLSSVIMVLPRNVRVRGQKVRTPYLRPPMTPVVRKNRAVAFTPAPFASALHTLQNAMLSVPAFYHGKDCCSSVPQ